MHQQLKSAISSYVTLTEAEFEKVLPYFLPIELAANTQLQKVETDETAFYFVDKGAVRTFFLRDVEEVNTGFYFENSFVLCFSRPAAEILNPRIVEAVDDSTLLYIKRNDYEMLNRSVIKLNVFGRKLVEEALV